MRNTHRPDSCSMPQTLARARIINAAIIFLCLLTGPASAALDGIRLTDDLARKYLADDVMTGTDGWIQVANAADRVDFHKNATGHLEYATNIIGGGCWMQQAASGDYWMANVTTTTSWTVEVGVKVSTPSAGETHDTAMWIDGNGVGMIYAIRDTGSAQFGTASTNSYDNTDAFHRFRVVFDAVDNLIYVWRDGELLETLAQEDPGGAQRLIIGDPSSSVISGVVQYEYIAVDATGAYEPDSTVPYCGQLGTVYLASDINSDCYVNLEDVAIMASNWLECTDVFMAECQDNL